LVDPDGLDGSDPLRTVVVEDLNLFRTTGNKTNINKSGLEIQNLKQLQTVVDTTMRQTGEMASILSNSWKKLKNWEKLLILKVYNTLGDNIFEVRDFIQLDLKFLTLDRYY
jgi:hypothetical protein